MLENSGADIAKVIGAGPSYCHFSNKGGVGSFGGVFSKLLLKKCLSAIYRKHKECLRNAIFGGGGACGSGPLECVGNGIERACVASWRLFELLCYGTGGERSFYPQSCWGFDGGVCLIAE
ncbi:Uncharacterised protein [Chlamydia trachomatis]|nr:Uncharacterised protein [Chlamydia trachomatis]